MDSIHLPPHVYEKLNSIRKATKQLSQQLGRTPTIPEIAARLEMSLKQIRQCLEWAQPTLSLNQLVRDGSEDELGSLVPDKCATPDELLVQSSVADELRQMMAKLTPLQTQVLSRRFGLVNGRELTFSEIGKKFNVSKQRVHQVAVKAIARMKPKNTAKPELAAPDAVAALYADTMPEEEAVVSDYCTPNIEDIWSAIANL
jgi:RNA polymerase nonessential primary-like sigma factor